LAVAGPLSQRYSLMVESSPAAMIVTGGDGLIQFLNAETEHMFGYRSGELVGRSIEALIPERFRARHAGLLVDFFDDPSERPIGAGRDLTAMRRDGTEFPVEIGLTPIETQTGLVVMATVLDISRRKKSEDALVRRAAELEAAVKGAVDGVVMIDETGVIQWLNPAASRLFGYESAELVGQNVSVLMPETFAGEHGASLRRRLRAGRAKIIGVGREVEGRRKDGSIFPIDLRMNVVPIAGKRLFAGFIRDLSDRRKLEARMKELHADRFKAIGGIAAALAHEVNQPLSAGATYLKTARRLLQIELDQRPVSVEDVLDGAAAQIMRAGQIISNLREFVTLSEPNKTRESLHELIRDAYELMSGGAKQAGVRVTIELGATNDTILADGAQIKRVLLNLMRNAIEAMKGCETRELMITTRVTDGGVIEIDLADTGCGFSKELERELFEPFSGAKTKGMGVGLPISRAIVEAHYGKIWAEPKPGGGAIFRFTLPLAEAERSR
jgi:two-component system sensor kinase FixL